MFVATIAAMKSGLKDHKRKWYQKVNWVATIAAMKSGLKVAKKSCTHSKALVATIAPMKRGLKACSAITRSKLPNLVATIAPMKRGLKGKAGHSITKYKTGSNHCPDEKGTERLKWDGYIFDWLSSNHCPDEKDQATGQGAR